MRIVLRGDALGVSMANPGQVGAVFADKNAGVGKAINLTGVTLSCADAGNYTLSRIRGLMASILPLPIVGPPSNNGGCNVGGGGQSLIPGVPWVVPSQLIP